MTIEQLRKKLTDELDRAEKDAEMSADPDDLSYHNGEQDALNFALELLERIN